ncbi:MAG: IS21 family transposase [Chloroflexota bacterium]|nr:IS21 family transposase [Chloroflexota bacterium]
MKSTEEIMKILQVYDQTLSYRETARQCGCSPHTVIAYVKKRRQGALGDPLKRPRASIIDPYRAKIEELVAESSGKVRAKAVCKRLKNMGYRGSDRTVRSAVAAAKKAYQKQNRRIFRPWVTEPGHWAQFDWADGPAVGGRKTYLFCAWLAWSRYRIVLPVYDRKQPSLIGCLSEAMAIFGGTPAHWLTDNQKAITPGRIANLPLKHPEMVRFARHYGTTMQLCMPADPQTKGGSERTVALAKQDLLPSDLNLRSQYQSFGELADACDEFMREVNTRAHRVTRRAPIKMLAEERRSLHPLPRTPFAAALGRERTVDPGDGLIAWESARYSAPSELAGEKVLVREQGDQLIISARSENGGGWREVARHRLAGRGARVIDEDHYAGDPPPGALRREPIPQNPLQAEFLGIGPNAGRWLKAACDAGAGRLGEKLVEIVELARLEGREDVDAALAVAEHCERFGFGDIASILVAGSPRRLHRPPEDAFPRQETLKGWRDFGANGSRDA